MQETPKINVIHRNSEIVMSEKPYPVPTQGLYSINSARTYRAKEDVRIFFEPKVSAALFEEIEWGAGGKKTDQEKAGILVGKYYVSTNNERPLVWGEVTAIIPFDRELVSATKTSIMITKEAWREMFAKYSEYRNNGFLMLGWYHTHLGGVPPRFSGTDKETQSRFFTGTYSFAVILNPNQRRWMAFYGPNAAECSGDIFVDKEKLDRFRDPRITIHRVNGDPDQPYDDDLATVGRRRTERTEQSQARIAPGESIFRKIRKKTGVLIENLGRMINPESDADSDAADDADSSADSSAVPGIQIDNTRGTPTRSADHISILNEVQRPECPRITLRDKPKITILPKDIPDVDTRRVISSIETVYSDAPLNRIRHDRQDLQVIDPNVIEIEKSLLILTENAGTDCDDPVNAHICENDDLTLEISLSEDADNAVIRIAKQSIETAFPEDTVADHISRAIETINNGSGENLYLVYFGSTSDAVEILLLNIKRRKENEQNNDQINASGRAGNSV